MWYFLVSDAFTFSALLITYGTIRASNPTWADPNKVFNSFPGLEGMDIPLGFVSVMTFILILSSVFIVRAVQEGHLMNRVGVVKWMLLGILGGAAFLGQLFFLITGFHGFHVFSGVVINCIVCAMAATGSLERRGHYEMVEKVGLYWHFVDLVWIFVFLAFYLL